MSKMKFPTFRTAAGEGYCKFQPGGGKSSAGCGPAAGLVCRTVVFLA